ncbi:MAG TPA: hypothetical protein VN857_05320 [Chthoniobacterales bacterium]|jgi:hypothetical protein|nr:hypothetical protein [Chthoniobacterales bacterium]
MKENEAGSPERNLKAVDAYGLVQLCFATVMGLASAVAAVFTTMLPLSAGWQYFWLAICLATFLLAIVAVVSLFSAPGTGLSHDRYWSQQPSLKAAQTLKHTVKKNLLVWTDRPVS